MQLNLGSHLLKSSSKKILAIFFVALVIVGFFVVGTSFYGGNSFNKIESVLIRKYKSAGTLRQKTLEIVGIYYLMSSDQDLDILMVQLQRYDELAENFQSHLKIIREILSSQKPTQKVTEAVDLSSKIENLFSAINSNARVMTLSVMEGNREGSKVAFRVLNSDLGQFQKLVGDFEDIIVQELKNESSDAQQLLRLTMLAGIIVAVVGILGVLILRIRREEIA